MIGLAGFGDRLHRNAQAGGETPGRAGRRTWPSRCRDRTDAGGADCAPPRAASDALAGRPLPRQGAWSDEDYPWPTDHGRRLIEFTDGRIEELPLPPFTHLAILSLLEGFVAEVAEVSDAPESGA